MWESPQITGVMPVDGNRATSSAMTIAAPRMKPYGEAAIRPTRTGISQSSRPRCDSVISRTGSGRLAGAAHSPSARRGTCCRSSLPIRYRSRRAVGRWRTDVNAALSAAARTTWPCAEAPGLGA
jgi:hypothetical protein